MSALQPLPASRLSELNQSLRPTANTYRNSPPDVALRALAFRARSGGASSNESRSWLCLHSRLPDVAALAARRDVLDPLLVDADQHHQRSSSPAGRAEMRDDAATLLVAHFFLPVEAHRNVSRRAAASARRCLAVLGHEFLPRAGRDGFDSIYFSEPEMAYSLGVSLGTARSYLKTCKKAGWVTKPKSRRGAPSRWRLRALTDDKKAWLASYDHLAPLISALAAGDATHPFVELFYAADHAAWGHGHRTVDGKAVDASLDQRIWLAAIAMEVAPHPVDVDLTLLAPGRRVSAETRLWLSEMETVGFDLGLPSRRVRELLRDWQTVIDGPGETITEDLDAYAALTGADREQEVALERRKQQKVDRMVGIHHDRAEKAAESAKRKAKKDAANAARDAKRAAAAERRAARLAEEATQPGAAAGTEMRPQHRIERIKVRIPERFDPDRHQDALLKRVSAAHGPGWEVESVDVSGARATLVRHTIIEGAA